MIDNVVWSKVHSFQCKDALVATDPAFPPRVMGAVVPVVPGLYSVYIEQSVHAGWGRRINRLVVLHENYVNHDVDWYHSPNTLGVDSATMAIHCSSGSVPAGYDFNKKDFNAHESGVVVLSGYGDGFYQYFVAQNQEGRQCGLYIIFIHLPDFGKKESQ